MRVLWFHLMPYKDLSQEFKKEHSSIWVTLGTEVADPVKMHEYYNEYMD